jgi:hypothetical protein
MGVFPLKSARRETRTAQGILQLVDGIADSVSLGIVYSAAPHIAPRQAFNQLGQCHGFLMAQLGVGLLAVVPNGDGDDFGLAHVRNSFAVVVFF